MSRGNVEVVREMWQAFGELGIDAASDQYYTHDAVIEDIPDLPDGSTYVGPAGFRERYWQFVAIWGDFTIEPMEFIDAGNGVVVVAAMSGRAPLSSLALDAPVAFVYVVQDRKIVRDCVFASKKAALQAVGLI